MRMTYKIATLGCKVNQQESEGLAALFQASGFAPARRGEEASVCVINSCTVTSVADSKTRQKIRQARSANPGALVCVVGCMPEVSREALLAMPEVDLVVGSADKERVAGLAMEALTGSGGTRRDPALPLPIGAAGMNAGRTRALIKAEDGCDRFCAYCVIPYARGAVRSKPAGEVIREAKALLEAGYRELVLTGVNLALYGKERTRASADAGGLYGLVKALCSLDAANEYRVRLGSLEPTAIDAREAERIAGVKGVCPQLHLSLQSGAAGTLEAMGRPYTPEGYEKIVHALRGIDPLFSVTTDVIVGFPGETDADFEESLEFVKRMGFARVHVFKYSKRPGTRAAEMPGQIKDGVKAKRSALMSAAAEAGAARFLALNAGKKRRTLIFGPDKSGVFIRGLTDNGLDVRLPIDTAGSITNEFVDIVPNFSI